MVIFEGLKLGDIRPYTRSEQLYAIFTMLLASGVFGYTMNSIQSVFSSDLQDEDKILAD
jgi:hypothetical protein